MQAKYYIICGLHRKYYDSLDDVFDHEGFYYVDDYNNIKVYDYYSCQRIDPEEIERLHKIYCKKLTKERIDTYWGKRPYKFRCGPVPGIRKWYRGGPPVSMNRYKQELTEGWTRTKRKAVYEDNAAWWDAPPRCVQKNWKSQRKTQWKG